MHNDPAGAVKWINQIGDERQRSSSVEQLANNWIIQDQAAASQWMATQEMSQELRERLQRRVELQHRH